ncbi:MAG: Holliday junction resolvase RuvX [Patescibacteria group bacterium]
MVKTLGVDYGSKRIGIAVSDDNGRIAFPKIIVENTKGAVDRIADIAKTEGAKHIVVGESLNTSGEENEIMKEARAFAEKLAADCNLPLSFEKEFFTSVEARRFQDEGRADSRAAAIMLQRYLDKINN